MKKILLISMLLLGTMTFAQETFVRKYVSMILTENFIASESQEADLTVVFNPNEQRKIVFYFGNGERRVYYQLEGVTEGKTNAGEQYQFIKCLDEKGVTIFLQLFDELGCLRVIISEGYKIEFYTY
jgi:hypothetical protein